MTKTKTTMTITAEDGITKEVEITSSRELPTLEEVKEKIKDEHFYGDKVDLVYIDYRDQLNRDQVDAYITEEYDPDLIDRIMEAQSDQVCEIMRPYIDDLSDYDEDVLRAWLFESDNSDPMRGLVRNTPDVTVVMFGEELYSRGGWNADTERVQEVADSLKELGVVLTESDMADVINESYEGGQVTLRMRCSVEDARNLYQQGGTVTVRDPDVGLLDRYNGAGFLVRPDGPFTITIPKKTISLESTSGGYTWEETACPTACGSLDVVSLHPIETTEGN